MHPGQKPRPPCILLVTLHEILSRFVVQTALREGHDQQTSNDRQDVTERGGGSPIFFERVDANGSCGGIDIGVVDFCDEVAPGRSGGEVCGEYEFELEVAGVVGRLLGTFDFGLCA